jgi:hypothetical protein
MWPVPVNVRLNPFVANQLLDITATCSNEQIELDDYPEYAHDLTSRLPTQVGSEFTSSVPNWRTGAEELLDFPGGVK